MLTVTAIYYWPLAVLLALLFPIYMWLTALTSRRWQRIEARKNHRVDVAGGRFAEVVGQVKVTKSFDAEARELNSFASRFGRTVRLTRGQSAFWHRMDTLRGGAMNLIFMGIYMVLFVRTLDGHFTLGEMVMLLQLVNMAKQPVFMMSWIVDAAQRAIAGSRDYFSVMEQEVEPTANHELIDAAAASTVPTLDTTEVPALHPQPGEPAVAFDRVWFSYEADDPVLKEVSFKARPGERIGLVGASGGGKTTIVNLLLGLYRPDSEAISVCGHDTRELSSAQLRASVGVVFQEPNLFSGTIRENIAYGRPTASDAEVEECARPRVHRRLRRRLRHGHRRARPAAVRRPEAAHCDRARDAQRRPHIGTRRGDVRPGQRLRAGGASWPGGADARAHHLGDCPPALHDRRGGHVDHPRPGSHR